MEIFLGEPPANVKQFIIEHYGNAQPVTPTAPDGKVLFKTSVGGEWQEEDADISDGVFNDFASKQSAVEVIIPSKDANGNDVTSIGEYIFFNCRGLTSVTIPNSVMSIGNAAFAGSSLTSVMISNNVMNIGGSAFAGCNLTSVTIPDSVTSIGNYAFYDCSELTNATIGNNMTNIATTMFENCRNLINVTIGSRVISIKEYAFKMCSSLTSITIPNSVTSIGFHAFYGCGLKSVTIPNTVKSIGYNAFELCEGLTNVTVLGHPAIDILVFYDCQQLSEMSMLNFTCNEVKNNAMLWGIAVPAKQLVTIQCFDGYVILNDKSQSSDGKTNV